jgi:hypothetical protein
MSFEIPDSAMWCVDDFVDIGSFHHLHVTAMSYDSRCVTFSLIADDGDTFRYIAGDDEPTRTGHATRAHRIIDMNLPYFH